MPTSEALCASINFSFLPSAGYKAKCYPHSRTEEVCFLQKKFLMCLRTEKNPRELLLFLSRLSNMLIVMGAIFKITWRGKLQMLKQINVFLLIRRQLKTRKTTEKQLRFMTSVLVASRPCKKQGRNYRNSIFVLWFGTLQQRLQLHFNIPWPWFLSHFWND